MANEVRYSARWDRLIKRAEAFLDSQTLLRAVNRATREIRDMIVQRYMGGANTSANRLARNTGKMEAKTVARRATIDGDGAVKASIGINVPYASVHFSDDGRVSTIIRPKRAQALAVPFPGAPVGGDKRPILPAKSSLITKKFTHNGVLWGRLPGQKTQPLFLMRNSVTVPARVNVQRDIEPRAKAIMAGIIQAELDKRLS